jgi:hypothetical protein
MQRVPECVAIGRFVVGLSGFLRERVGMESGLYESIGR